jgi:hypothetical protein
LSFFAKKTFKFVILLTFPNFDPKISHSIPNFHQAPQNHIYLYWRAFTSPQNVTKQLPVYYFLLFHYPLPTFPDRLSTTLFPVASFFQFRTFNQLLFGSGMFWSNPEKEFPRAWGACLSPTFPLLQVLHVCANRFASRRRHKWKKMAPKNLCWLRWFVALFSLGLGF